MQCKLVPQDLTGSPYFVTYAWTTAGVWYSPDGTSGTFEPYGGDGAKVASEASMRRAVVF